MRLTCRNSVHFETSTDPFSINKTSRDKVIHTNKAGKFLKNSKSTKDTGVQVETEKGHDLTTSISAAEDESLKKNFTHYQIHHIDQNNLRHNLIDIMTATKFQEQA